MKIVMSPENVAHTWAHQLQDEAKTPTRNLFFSGASIYSYGHHFCIGRHVERNGVRAVLFTTETYSVTTAKHINITRSASSHLNRIYCPRPDAQPSENFRRWKSEADGIASHLQKSTKPEKWVSELQGLAHRVKTYAEYMGETVPEALHAILNITNKAGYSAYAEKIAEYEKREEERKKKEAYAQWKKNLKKWERGEISYLPSAGLGDRLRVNGERLQTSQGVFIPMETARRIHRNLDNLKPGDKILDFEVLNVDKKSVRVGCHTFDIKYLRDFGNKLFTA